MLYVALLARVVEATEAYREQAEELEYQAKRERWDNARIASEDLTITGILKDGKIIRKRESQPFGFHLNCCVCGARVGFTTSVLADVITGWAPVKDTVRTESFLLKDGGIRSVDVVDSNRFKAPKDRHFFPATTRGRVCNRCVEELRSKEKALNVLGAKESKKKNLITIISETPVAKGSASIKASNIEDDNAIRWQHDNHEDVNGGKRYATRKLNTRYTRVKRYRRTFRSKG
jgi:hypothetical protein